MSLFDCRHDVGDATTASMRRPLQMSAHMRKMLISDQKSAVRSTAKCMRCQVVMTSGGGVFPSIWCCDLAIEGEYSCKVRLLVSHLSVW